MKCVLNFLGMETLKLLYLSPKGLLRFLGKNFEFRLPRITKSVASNTWLVPFSLNISVIHGF